MKFEICLSFLLFLSKLNNVFVHEQENVKLLCLCLIREDTR